MPLLDPDADAVRWRTQRWLLTQWRTGGGETARARIEGGLELAERIGALTPQESTAWRALLAPAAPRAPAPAALPPAARERLDALVAELEAAGPGSEAPSARAELEMELGLLVEAGLLTEDEATGYDDRADRALGLPTVAQRAAAEAKRRRRLIVGATSGALRVVQVERGRGELVVDFVISGVPDPQPSVDKQLDELLTRTWPPIALADDLGTSYVPRGGNTGTSETGTTGSVHFAPLPPRGARVLRISAGADVVEVALR